MSNFIDLWNIDLLESESVKRRIGASEIKQDAITVNSENQTAIVCGSGSVPYSVTLESCTCEYFSGKGKPCKHMYRLALELGQIPPLPEVSREKKKAFKEMVPSELEHWTSLFQDGYITAEKYVKLRDAILAK